MKKRILAVLLCVLLTTASVSVAYVTGAELKDLQIGDVAEEVVYGEGEEQNTYSFVVKASNDRFALAIDEETTYISLTDKLTGQVWYSNPPIAPNSDPYITEGIARTNIRSVLYLRYTTSNKASKETNSYSGSVMKDSAEITVLDNGIRVDYDFKEIKIVIPVQYTLTEDGMVAEILYSEILDSADSTEDSPRQNTVNNIDFLQYFGAAGEEDEGYLVVPDGAGAILNFNNKKNTDLKNVKSTAELIYTKEFYGPDHSETTESVVTSSRSEKLSLPVFGMVRNGYGFLAEITSGAEAAKLNATTSGHRFIGAYNAIYTTANYRTNYSIPLMGQVGGQTLIAAYNAVDPVSLESYAIQYHFSDNPATTYVTLASDYRERLVETGALTKDEVSDMFYTEFYGGVEKKKSFLGVLYNARETLTSFEDAQAILEDLKAGGVDNISVQFNNFSDDFFSKDIEVNLDPSGSLGGKKDMNALKNFVTDNSLYMQVAGDFVTLASGGNGYSSFFDVANAINVSPIEVFPISLASNTFDTSKAPYYLVDPQKYGEAVDALIESVADYGYGGLYFDENSLQLYSDLSPDGYQSERTSDAQAAQMARLAEAGITLTMSNPNDYLMTYADYLVDIPVCSSKALMFDGDIPFLQIVLRGMKNFGGECMNITDVSDDAFLRHLEYGTDMRYALIQADSEALLKTDHTFLYSATYTNFADQIKARYVAFEELGAATQGATIADHSRVDNVSVTTYENGAKVYVNYNNEARTVDGVEIAAMSYAIV